MRNSGNAEQIEVGWWPGDSALPARRVLRLRVPGAEGFGTATLEPPAARWDTALGEYVLDWDDVRLRLTPTALALAFGRSAIRHACTVCGWDPLLADSAQGIPPPVA